MVVAALWAAVAKARPAACLIGDVVLVVAGDGGSAADGADAGRVADLGQVAELDARVVSLGFEPVVAVLGGKAV
jgi:hypothetical protein